MRPSKDDLSGQKALQGAKTETKELLGGTEEYSVSRTRCPFLAPLIFECLRPLWFLHYTRGRRDKVTLIFAKSVFHGFFPTSSVANFFGGVKREPLSRCAEREGLSSSQNKSLILIP